MNLAKLTSLSTTTLSLLLERQRLQTMTQAAPASSTQQIVRNLEQLRTGILALEESEGKRTEASSLLRSQFGRMREMLGRDGEVIESCAAFSSPHKQFTLMMDEQVTHYRRRPADYSTISLNCHCQSSSAICTIF